MQSMASEQISAGDFNCDFSNGAIKNVNSACRKMEEKVRKLENGSVDGGVSEERPVSCRQLTSEQLAKLESDCQLVSPFQQMKLEKEAKKNWDLFYKRNGTRFFKDRHWTTREFEELLDETTTDGRRNLLEIGCGVGNFVFPLITDKKTSYYVFACDFSTKAIDLVKQNDAYDESLCKAFQADLTSENFSDALKDAASSDNSEIIDVASLIFVLSAIHPDKMQQSLQNVHKILRPGGKVLFRDYGLYDHAMLRFSSGHKLNENFYVRQDGTRAFYFSTEHLSTLATSAGFQILALDYVERKTVNAKAGIEVPRIFVQAKFLKSSAASSE